jgi:hypothetical protein
MQFIELRKEFSFKKVSHVVTWIILEINGYVRVHNGFKSYIGGESWLNVLLMDSFGILLFLIQRLRMGGVVGS